MCDLSHTGHSQTSCDQSPPSDVGTSESHNEWLICMEGRDSGHWCNDDVRTRVVFVDQIRLGPPVLQKLPRSLEVLNLVLRGNKHEG